MRMFRVDHALECIATAAELETASMKANVDTVMAGAYLEIFAIYFHIQLIENRQLRGFDEI
jgi:hypothetical protein